MINDIVTTLRREPFYHPTSRLNSFGMPQLGFELTSFNLIAADEIERLRKERDEARREILESLHPDLRENYAAARGWDCFDSDRWSDPSDECQREAL